MIGKQPALMFSNDFYKAHEAVIFKLVLSSVNLTDTDMRGKSFTNLNVIFKGGFEQKIS